MSVSKFLVNLFRGGERGGGMLVGVAEKYVLAFDTPEKIESWDSVTDSGYGGKSRANIQHIVGSSSTYARFSGNTSLHKSGKLVRSGFCAIRSQKWEPPLPLEDFEGLEISLRTDGRTYTLNMEPEAFMPNELYQGFLTTQPGKWDIVQLPFNRLLCTLGGYPKTNQQQVDKLKLISLGIAIADGKEGEFQLDIEYIKAIRGMTMSYAEPKRKQMQGNLKEWPLDL